VYIKLGDVNKITMEFLEKNRFKGIIFLGNGKVHNGYIDKVQKYDDYLKWAVKNIY
jgi:sRNA-binding regulator protein Hfq